MQFVRPASVYMPRRFVAQSQKLSLIFKTDIDMLSCKPLYSLSLIDMNALDDDNDMESKIKGIAYEEDDEEIM
jgi:hypothetical protein